MTDSGQPEDLPPPCDRQTLKFAMRAFRKRLKAARLDDESKLGGGTMTSGGASAIAGIRPPTDFPKETWDELARQGRLKRQAPGVYGLND